MATADRPDDVFVAAGAPWYLTLFGRDSLWTARMLLPLGTELAAGTLRTLAARLGHRLRRPDRRRSPARCCTSCAVRRLDGETGESFLPPLYYGTIDATPLWICLLHDAWRWGLDPAVVEELLDPLERALGWLRDGRRPRRRRLPRVPRPQRLRA